MKHEFIRSEQDFFENQYFRWTPLAEKMLSCTRNQVAAGRKPEEHGSLYLFVITNSSDAGVGAGTVNTYRMLDMLGRSSSAPGPLQLLPTAEYGNGWLKLKDGAKEYAYPENGDPYGDIYTKRGKWWSLCDEALINPLNEERDPGKRQAQTEKDWSSFERIIDKGVKSFHDKIKQKYHPNTHAFFGSHSDNRAYGAVTWQNHWAASGSRGPLGRILGQHESKADVANGQGFPGEINNTRTVKVSVEGGVLHQETRSYRISEPEENGDGTVPHRSGIAPRDHCKSFLQVNVAHEPAYKFSKSDDNRRACRFTLRAIVQIAQDVQQTSLRYD